MRDNSFREERDEQRELQRQRRHARRHQFKFKRSGSILSGMVVLAVGTVFMLREFNVDFPHWLFTWPMILVVFGFFAGAGNSFRDPGWLFISGIGVVFLMKIIWPEIPVWNYTWPAIIIFIGLMMIIAPRRKQFWANKTRYQWTNDDSNPMIPPSNADIIEEAKAKYDEAGRVRDNWLDVVSVFGNIKKQVYTKDFKGGDIVSVFGGAEINLMQADFTGPIYIDMVQIFGGAKLIVPPHWQIRSEMAAIFGGIEDKRTPQVNYDADKVVILHGTTLFGGIEIKSY